MHRGRRGESASDRATGSDGAFEPNGRLPNATAAVPDLTGCEAKFSSARCVNMADYVAATARDVARRHRDHGGATAANPELIDGVPVINLGGATVDPVVRLRDGSVPRGISRAAEGYRPSTAAMTHRLGRRHRHSPATGMCPVPANHPTDVRARCPRQTPEALAAAKELRVPRLDIPIDHDGQYEVPVGEAMLPERAPVARRIRVRSPRTGRPTCRSAEGVVQLDIRSLDDPGRLFWNIYDHGRSEGTERVEAILVFDVLHHEPGAELSIEGRPQSGNGCTSKKEAGRAIAYQVATVALGDALLTLTAEQVRTLAPDASAARAGEALGDRRRWSAAGRSDEAAWGLCQGSGSTPYQVAVDLAGPAYKCSCPSRKIPCKHALGLLFLVADGGAPAATPPDWAQPGWTAAPAEPPQRPPGRSAQPRSTPRRARNVSHPANGRSPRASTSSTGGCAT